MIRKIINIDEELCIGCGLCASACNQGAIGMVDGKAKLLRDDYCDGLGVCLPVCPTGAISFEEREAAQFDKDAVKENKEKEQVFQGCPGSMSKSINKQQSTAQTDTRVSVGSQLNQWPVQIQLVPTVAPFFENANLLIAADCAAYSYGNFHADFMKNKITIIGCPKLDSINYSEKLTEIIKNNNIKSVTIARMEVPCCGGLENAAKQAIQNSGKFLPWQIITISTDGEILD